jgi:hypothetical protein
LAPRADARFTPGEATRLLRPAESFDVVRLDLAARFDLARSGSYRLKVSLTKESGIAEGDSNEVSFQVVERLSSPDEAR